MKKDLCERTFQFAIRIVEFCQELGRRTIMARTIGGQLLYLGTSIGANIEEGQAGQSKADFISKYSVARKEARETHYWLRLLVGAEICPSEKAEGVLSECNELIAILTTIIKKTRENGS